MKRTRSKKSRDTVPLRYIECAIYVLVKKKRKKRGKLARFSKGSTNIKDVGDVTLNQVWGGGGKEEQFKEMRGH